jgi:lipoprotein-anchoring transpeptidase ErfK/SrfK
VQPNDRLFRSRTGLSPTLRIVPPVFSRLSPSMVRAARQHSVPLSPHVLEVTIRTQHMRLFRRTAHRAGRPLWRQFRLVKRYRISSSRMGTGQAAGSNQTPLGLHRLAEKIGAGLPVGTVFRSREPIGLVSQGMPDAPIAHRILWLEGLEPGLNRGDGVDSHDRYIYIHGIGDERNLGKPASIGCIHLAASDLLPLFDRIPEGTLVWIQS